MTISFFHSNLCKILESKKKEFKCIPRRIKPNESLKIHHKYWLQDFESIVKVEEMFYINDDIYYTIKDCLTGRYAAISITDNSVNYELLNDYNDIISTDDIVNTKIYYTGAEIKTWFFYNGSNKYESFYSYLDFYDNKHSISDSKNYFLVADVDEKTGKYINCRISLKRY